MAGMPKPRMSAGVEWEGDLPAPLTSYMTSSAQMPMISSNRVPSSTNIANSAVVQRKPNRQGIRYFYSHGGVEMPLGMGQAGPMTGIAVVSSAFQRWLVQLHDWVIYDGLYQAGYPRNLGYSFRAEQLSTKKSGGSTDARMDQRPLFPRVQKIPRFTTVPPVYPTRSANS